MRSESIVTGLVGNALRSEREKRGLSRAAIATKTKIPASFIAQVEDTHPALMPQTAYSAIYLKAYCAFLEFDAAEMLRVFKSIAAHPDRLKDEQQRHPTKSISEWKLIAAPTLLRNLIVGAAVVGLLTYLTMQLMKIVQPPAIDVASPADGVIVTGQEVKIEGKTEREVDLRINGEPVFLNENGAFSDTLTLQDGMNVITIVGKKKYGQPQTLTRHVIVEPEKPQAAAPEIAPVPAAKLPLSSSGQ